MRNKLKLFENMCDFHQKKQEIWLVCESVICVLIFWKHHQIVEYFRRFFPTFATLGLTILGIFSTFHRIKTVPVEILQQIKSNWCSFMVYENQPNLLDSFFGYDFYTCTQR